MPKERRGSVQVVLDWTARANARLSECFALGPSAALIES